MSTTRLTRSMRRSLEVRLTDLDTRIDVLNGQRENDESPDTAALRMELTRERTDVIDALRDATLIDDEPFDAHAIEIGDLVTIEGEDGEIERYVLADGRAGSRARSDWVSVSSPLGAAILGRSTGDEVRVQSPRGATTYRILGFARASDDAATASDPGAPLLPSDTFLG
ncbi:MAG: GreA/GreB family elongation factor [Actinomycetota bacterium]|nr:GreA/GreB family elongation factor [Actinomycetota bacterium]